MKNQSGSTFNAPLQPEGTSVYLTVRKTPDQTYSYVSPVVGEFNAYQGVNSLVASLCPEGESLVQLTIQVKFLQHVPLSQPEAKQPAEQSIQTENVVYISASN